VAHIAALAVRAAGQMTMRDAEEEVRSSIDLVVQLERRNGKRTISPILELHSTIKQNVEGLMSNPD
jgi:hypothetical protein